MDGEVALLPAGRHPGRESSARPGEGCDERGGGVEAVGDAREHAALDVGHLDAVGPSICTTHPHSFFGPLTPSPSAGHTHLDHHLRQFGV